MSRHRINCYHRYFSQLPAVLCHPSCRRFCASLFLIRRRSLTCTFARSCHSRSSLDVSARSRPRSPHTCIHSCTYTCTRAHPFSRVRCHEYIRIQANANEYKPLPSGIGTARTDSNTIPTQLQHDSNTIPTDENDTTPTGTPTGGYRVNV